MKEKRTKDIKICLTPEEFSALMENKKKAGVSSTSSYARKMLFDGYIINVDLSGLSIIEQLMRKASDNINQIARRVNINGSVYSEDIKEIQHRQNDIWNTLASLHEIISGVNQWLPRG